MLLIDEFACRSKLSNINPNAKIILGVVPMILCLFFNAASVSTATILAMAILTVKYSGISLIKYIKLLSIPLGFLALSTVTVVFGQCEQDSSMLIGFGISGRAYGITAQSLLLGLNISLKAFGTVCCMYFISLNTTMTDILNALGEWGIPKLLIRLMELMYRYIFVFLEEARKIQISQISRLGYIDFKTAMNSAGQLIGMLFLRVYLRSDRIYEALQSRGYEGEFRTIKKNYMPFRRLYIYCALLGFILTVLGIMEKAAIW